MEKDERTLEGHTLEQRSDEMGLLSNMSRTSLLSREAYSQEGLTLYSWKTSLLSSVAYLRAGVGRAYPRKRLALEQGRTDKLTL